MELTTAQDNAWWYPLVLDRVVVLYFVVSRLCAITSGWLQMPWSNHQMQFTALKSVEFENLRFLLVVMNFVSGWRLVQNANFQKFPKPIFDGCIIVVGSPWAIFSIAPPTDIAILQRYGRKFDHGWKKSDFSNSTDFNAVKCIWQPSTCWSFWCNTQTLKVLCRRTPGPQIWP